MVQPIHPVTNLGLWALSYSRETVSASWNLFLLIDWVVIDLWPCCKFRSSTTSPTSLTPIRQPFPSPFSCSTWFLRLQGRATMLDTMIPSTRSSMTFLYQCAMSIQRSTRTPMPPHWQRLRNLTWWRMTRVQSPMSHPRLHFLRCAACLYVLVVHTR